MKCVICKGTRFTAKLRIDRRYSYICCSDCKNWNLYPAPKNVKSVYNEEYFTNLSPEGFILKLIYKMRLFPPYENWVGKTRKREKILDVGCGDGSFLSKMRDYGWDVYGSDISKSSKIFLTKRGLDNKFFLGELNKIQSIKNNLFDAVTFWHVIEHLNHPREDLDKVLKILKPGGHIFGEVPSGDSYVLKIFRRYYNWLRIPEHTLYWTKRGLSKELVRAGFKNIKIFSPPKANLNFSLSFYNFLSSAKISIILAKLLFVIMIPISITLIVTLSIFNRGEVLRFVAEK